MPAPDFHNYDAKVDRAARRVDTDATDAQREAGNYRSGLVHMHGLSIVIECPKGSTRTGVGKDGKRWEKAMHAHYGRIKRTVGHDGEPVDVFIGDHPQSQLVFVVSQLTEDGDLDEHKCMLGTRHLREAKDTYLKHYPENWERTRLGEVRGMLMSDFKEWLASNHPVKNRRKSAGDEAVAGLLASFGNL